MRKKTIEVQIGNVKIGGGNPVAIQSMTNTETANVAATVKQITELIDAGSEMVRMAVNSIDAAKAVPRIKEKLLKKGYEQPLIGDFHYNGHILLKRFPDCASSLDKYRINPGNIGTAESKDYNFKTVIEAAINNKKPVRIGVNWGSLDQSLFTRLTEKNARLKNPKPEKEVLYEAMVASAVNAAKTAEDLGLPENKIVLSVKMSEVQDVINVYEMLAARCNYALHLGLTEAGSGDKGLIASSAALAVLLQKGIGDTIRISLTPAPDRMNRVSTPDPRIKEVQACQLLLQTMGIRNFRPMVTSCPGCGRTNNDLHQKIAAKVNDHINKKLPLWRVKYPGIENLKIAVMGCVVNGPGESRHADIGISLPGKTEKPVAPVYLNAKLYKVLKGNNIAQQFIKILDEYLSRRFGRG